MRERQQLDEAVTAIKKLERDLEDGATLIELGEMEGDESSIREGEAVILAVEKEAASRQVETLLSGEADENDTYLEVHSGAGGTESQDWANMLMRMYLRWADKRGFTAEVIDANGGEVAGIKSATIQITGVTYTDAKLVWRRALES